MPTKVAFSKNERETELNEGLANGNVVLRNRFTFQAIIKAF